MNVYQEISQIIKEADGILIGASNGLSIASGLIFLPFQKHDLPQNLPAQNDPPHWKEKAARYQEFIQNLHGKKLVILEFGIGSYYEIFFILY